MPKRTPPGSCGGFARVDIMTNSKGPGKIAPKDVGDTLEGLLGIQTNKQDAGRL